MASCSLAYDWSLIPFDVFEVIQSVMRSFRTGAGLTNGQPTKFSCHSARNFSRSFAFTYSQYAFSNSQTCASSFAEVCPKAVALNARNKVMVRNMCRSYLTNQEADKVPTQIMVTSESPSKPSRTCNSCHPQARTAKRSRRMRLLRA